MTPTLTQLILLQSACCLVGWLVFFRESTLPKGIQLLTVIAYLTTPLTLLVKGTQSAVYASDLILPFLVLALVFSSQGDHRTTSPITLVLTLTLVGLPLLLLPFHVLASGGEVGMGARNVNGDIIWIYRNLTYAALFAYGVHSALSGAQFLSFVRLNVLLGGILAAFGILHYFGPVNLAIFEMLTWRDWVQEGYQESHAGLGFMGLYRASVGQWFATIVMLIAGTLAWQPTRSKLVGTLVMVLGIGMVLLSHSRAGMIGLGLGLLMLGYFGRGIGSRIIAGFGVAALFLWIGVQGDMFSDRVTSIFTGAQHATDRVKAWEKAVEYFTARPDSLALGVGPTNRAAVAKITGAYGAHNEYLDAVFRLGVAGLIGILLALWLLLKRSLFAPRNADAILNGIATTIGVTVTINIVMGISQDHLLHDYASNTMGVLLYLIYGVGIGTIQHNHKEVSTEQELAAPWMPRTSRRLEEGIAHS